MQRPCNACSKRLIQKAGTLTSRLANGRSDLKVHCVTFIAHCRLRCRDEWVEISRGWRGLRALR